MARLFGTDGVRGIANTELSCELAFRIGQAGAQILGNGTHAPRILIARDTRISGEMLKCSLISGICSVGGEAIDAGVLPTSGLAYLVKEYQLDAGVMISASHNSFEYNGIKWFDGNGFKLPDIIEDNMEELINQPYIPKAVGEQVGRPSIAHHAKMDYAQFLYALVEEDLSGFNVVLDCANGASSPIALALFERLGMDVHVICSSPNGININDACGSTSPACLQKEVVKRKADIGIAFDGDADRMIAVDHEGNVIDGDQIMAICACDLKERKQLKNDTLVVTVMSNLGMQRSLEKAGITVLKSNVGDRYVLELMKAEGLNFGGEQSGHFIFLDNNTTGDGLMSALQLLMTLARAKKSLHELAKNVEIFPQILTNVRIDKKYKETYLDDIDVMKCIQEVEKKLGKTGRVLVRASGTEPLLRIMLEGKNQEEIYADSLKIAKVLEEKCAGVIIY